MKGDFSKRYSVRDKNFRGVLHQQGRVLLDADWNDQTAIDNEWQATAAQDAFGPGIAAVPADMSGGFEVIGVNVSDGKVTVTLSPGRVWADGLLLTLGEETALKATYLYRPDEDTGTLEPEEGERDAVVLEVWQESFSGFQMSDAFPDSILEPALGGPDTTERILTSMALRLFRLSGGEACETIRRKLVDEFQDRGTLSVTLSENYPPEGVCPVIEKGGYTGLEHSLFRIEIARVNDLGVAMFKWSRFNGGLVGRGDVTVEGGTTTITITANRQVIERSKTGEFYLEVVEWSDMLGRWETTYGASVTREGDTLTVTDIKYDQDSWSPSGNVFFRLWDGIASVSEYVTASGDTDRELIDGIHLDFNPPGSDVYTAGDYWTFAVRAGGIENGTELLIDAPPEGIQCHRVALAEIVWPFNGNVDVDCRECFPALTGIRADDVGFDNHVCQMPDVNTVQDALDVLCRRLEGICTFAPKPGQGWENILNGLGENQDVHICFSTGQYPLDESYSFNNLGHVKISGSGAGTQLIASNSEAVFMFNNCESVTIQNLAAISGAGNREALNGTLTFHDCHNVTVENLSLKCSAGSRKDAACITIKNAEADASLARGKGLVRIRHCDLSIGHLQIGILLVNVTRAQVEDNFLAVARNPRRLSFDQLIQRKDYRAIFRKMMVSDAIIHENAPDFGTRDVTATFSGFSVRFNTFDALRNEWEEIIKANPPQSRRIRNNRDMLAHIELLADRILLNQGEITGGTGDVRGWYQLLNQQHPAVASQGIVVGGRIVKDIRIINNTIKGVLDGVHVGLSHRASGGTYRDIAERVKIENNTIGIIFPPIALRARFGIFIGNCNSCIVENNYVRVQRFQFTKDRHIEGIRIFGYLGRMIIVEKNHLENFSVGIYINPLNESSGQLFQWAVSDNMSPKARMALEVGDRPMPGETNEQKGKRRKRNGEKRGKIRAKNNYK